MLSGHITMKQVRACIGLILWQGFYRRCEDGAGGVPWVGGRGLSHTEILVGPRLVLPQAGLRPSNFHLGSAVHRQF